ncbi:MAG: hypothetical protein HOP96_07195 [Sphingomonas sp.]|nr:hypothetical protein [Sphingomonas sp.]
MRRVIPVAATLLLAACVSRGPQQAEPETPAPVEAPPVRSGLVGLTAGELIQRMGQPALQVREGPGLKLQFRGRACVLDAYLYPPPQGTGTDKVTYVETRTATGSDANQEACIASLTRS